MQMIVNSYITHVCVSGKTFVINVRPEGAKVSSNVSSVAAIALLLSIQTFNFEQHTNSLCPFIHTDPLDVVVYSSSSLSDNTIGPEGAQHLSMGLKNWPSLQTLK